VGERRCGEVHPGGVCGALVNLVVADVECATWVDLELGEG
jgi:hypothetical protein